MKPLPSDPYAFQARVFGALHADLFDIGSRKSSSFVRTDALLEISKQSKEGGRSPNKQPASNR